MGAPAAETGSKAPPTAVGQIGIKGREDAIAACLLCRIEHPVGLREQGLDIGLGGMGLRKANADREMRAGLGCNA